MKKFAALLMLSILLPIVLMAEGAVLVEIPPLSGRTSLVEQLKSHQFDNADQLRSVRRVGVGAGIAGNLGLAGAIIDFNIQPENAIRLGFGTGGNYNTFSAGYRHYLSEKAFAGYVSMDYAHWYSAPGKRSGFTDSNPGFLESRWLDSNQKQGGSFAISILSPAFGVSYFSLEGESKGTSVFAEVAFLMNVQRPQPIPQGSIGSVFYF